MSWAVGYDSNWDRDIGYGVPSTCDHPDCNNQIDRGLAHVCGGEPYGGDEGCGLYFCGDHLHFAGKGQQVCERCANDGEPFVPKPDVLKWIQHKLTCPTWQQWRNENPRKVTELEEAIRKQRER